MFLLGSQPTNGNLHQFLKHIILRLFLIVLTCEHLIDTGRVHYNIRNSGEFTHLRLAGITATIGDELANQI